MLSREHDPQLEAEGELALARLALDRGDLKHAAGHLAGAVALAPTHPEVLETFTQLTADHGTATLDLFLVTSNVRCLAAPARPSKHSAAQANTTSWAVGRMRRGWPIPRPRRRWHPATCSGRCRT